MENQRLYDCTAIVGDKGMGKSVLLRDIALLYMDSAKESGNPHPRVLIHDIAHSRAFSEITPISVKQLYKGEFKGGIRKLSGMPKSEKKVRAWIEIMYHTMSDGMIVFDEANQWIDPRGKIQPWQKPLFSQHRNKRLDMIFMFHQFREINIDIRGQMWRYIQFRTGDSDRILKDGENFFLRRAFPNSREMYQAWLRVDQSRHNVDCYESPNGGTVQHFETTYKSFESGIKKHRKNKE